MKTLGDCDRSRGTTPPCAGTPSAPAQHRGVRQLRCCELRTLLTDHVEEDAVPLALLKKGLNPLDEGLARKRLGENWGSLGAPELQDKKRYRFLLAGVCYRKPAIP